MGFLYEEKQGAPYHSLCAYSHYFYTMKNLLFIFFCSISCGGFAQVADAPKTPQDKLIIKEIPPLPVVEITDVATKFPIFPEYLMVRTGENELRRKYDTLEELIFMTFSDVWMADPGSRAR